MSEYQSDPSGDTEQFRAFARRGEPEPELVPTSGRPNRGLIFGVCAVVVVVVVAVAAFLIVGF